MNFEDVLVRTINFENALMKEIKSSKYISNNERRVKGLKPLRGAENRRRKFLNKQELNKQRIFNLVEEEVERRVIENNIIDRELMRSISKYLDVRLI